MQVTTLAKARHRYGQSMFAIWPLTVSAGSGAGNDAPKQGEFGTHPTRSAAVFSRASLCGAGERFATHEDLRSWWMRPPVVRQQVGRADSSESAGDVLQL